MISSTKTKPLEWSAVIAWSIALSAASSGFTSAYGLLGAGAGAAAGAVAAALVCRRNGSLGWQAGVFVGIAVALLALPWAFEFLPIPIGIALCADEILDIGPKAGLLAFIFRYISMRLRWFRSVEALGVAVLFAQGFAVHHRGNVNFPRGLMDIWIALGRAPELLLRLIGAVALLLAAMVLAAGTRRRRPLAKWTIAVLIPLTLFGVSWWLPQLPFLLPQPPPPPRSQLPDPPPPPPPEPRQIALVQLQGKILPPSRLGAFYFRSETMSRLDRLSFVQATGELSEADAAWSSPTNDILVGPKNSPTNPYAVLANVNLLVDTNPFVLVVPIQLSSIPKPGPPFQSAYQSISMRLDSSRYPDLDLGTFRQKLVDDTWTAAQSNLYLTAPQDQPLRDLATQIQSVLPEQLQEYLPLRVKVIRSWMNEQLAYSAKAGVAAEGQSITDFLLEKRAGGSKQFATAAVLLFRNAGIPARVAAGYKVPVGPDEDRSQFVITDAHAETWPEIFLSGTGWLPVPLNPTNILDRPPPPEDPEIEKILEEKLAPPPAQTRVRPDVRWLWLGMACVVVVYVLWAMADLHRRYLAVLLCPASTRHRLGLRAALSIVGSAGWKRQYGETYLDLEHRIHGAGSSSAMRVADAFRTLIVMYQDSYENKRVFSRMEWIRFIFRLEWMGMRHPPWRQGRRLPGKGGAGNDSDVVSRG